MVQKGVWLYFCGVSQQKQHDGSKNQVAQESVEALRNIGGDGDLARQADAWTGRKPERISNRRTREDCN